MKNLFYFRSIAIVTCFLILIVPATVMAIRTAPVITAGTITSCPNQTGKIVPLLVTGFTNITSYSLRIDFDPTVATFSGGVAHAGFSSVIFNVVPISTNLSRLMIIWFDFPPITLPAADTLAKLTFNFIGGSTSLVFNNIASGGGDCEYTDENGDPMTDVPTASYYINGAISSIAVGTPGAITGPGAVCGGSVGVNYSITPVMNATSYNWSLPSGFFVTGGQNTNSITTNVSLNSSSGNISVTPSNQCGPGSTSPSLSVTVNPLPAPTITGAASVCAGASGVTYNTESGMTSYTWNISSGGTITAGSGTNQIAVTWASAGAQTVSVNYTNANSCTAESATVKSVTVNPLPAPTITGAASVCMGTSGVTYNTESGMTGYTWSISSGGTITAGSGTNQITVTWSATGTQTVSVNYTNANSCTALSATVKSVTVNPLPAPTITGAASVCMGASGVTYITESGMTGYTWNISSGGTITAGSGTNQITVTWSATGTQSVSVNYTNANSCTAPSATIKNVTVNALPVPTINGEQSICVGATWATYTTESGMTGYTWGISSGGTITAGVGTNQITVTWSATGTQSVSVNYTNSSSCMAASATIINVTVNPLPVPTITGLDELCEGTPGVAYETETGMSNYSWTVSPGGMITSGAGSYQIVVTWLNPGAQSVMVNYANSNGCSAVPPSIKTVTVNPLPLTPEITVNDALLTSDAPIGNQWYYESNPIPGATDQTYLATQTGWYWDVVGLNNCYSDSSNHIYILVTGSEEPQPEKISIYPVPNNGRFTVAMTSATPQHFTMIVYNVFGVIVQKIPETEVLGTMQIGVSIGAVPNGVYTILIQSDGMQFKRKFIVEN